jgi:hypothetical protein
VGVVRGQGKQEASTCLDGPLTVWRVFNLGVLFYLDPRFLDYTFSKNSDIMLDISLKVVYYIPLNCQCRIFAGMKIQ